MIKEIFNSRRIRELGIKISKSPDALKNILPVFAFADLAPQITKTTSLLSLADWQIAFARGGTMLFVTGYYAATVASTLHANEGRTRLQKGIAKGALIGMGLGTAATDVLIATFPF